MDKKQIAKIIATSFGFGYGPKAPGTFGAFFGVLVYVVLAYFYGNLQNKTTSTSLDITLMILVVGSTIIGTWCAKTLEPDWGHDNGKIVIDESLGMWITLLFVPFSWTNTFLAFILFRVFDIWKPLGIKTIDTKMHSPFSVMLDDVLAGVYAALSLQGILYFL